MSLARTRLSHFQSICFKQSSLRRSLQLPQQHSTSSLHSSTLRNATDSTIHAYTTTASSSPHAASSSLFSTASKLAAALLISGSVMVATTSEVEAAPANAAAANAAAASSPPSTSSPSPSTSSAAGRTVSDLDLSKLDFRTLGVRDCPPLPESAPSWLQQQAKDISFQYRDLNAILDTTNHLIHDALSGENKISASYYFVEKVEERKDNGPPSNGAHAHPELAPSLDFEPQTPAAPSQPQSKVPEGAVGIPATPARTSYFSSILNFIPNLTFKVVQAEPSKAPSSSPAASTTASTALKAAANANAAAFSSFNTDSPPHMTALGPEVRAIFHVGKALCGHKGIVHGGMTAALMDEVSGAATFCSAGGGNFTANLNINYLRPVKAGQYLLIRAQAVKRDGRKTYVNISVEDGIGGVFARGTALYVKPKRLPAAVMVAATQ